MSRFMVLILLLVSFPACAQDRVDSLEKDVTRENKGALDDKFITLTFENDSIGQGSDQNYTNGARLSYFDLNASFPDIAHQIADYVPTFSINSTSSIFYSIGQNLYTPSDITSREQNPKDRPWAAFLYGSMGMTTLTGNHTDELEATLGIVGPLALGEPVQSAVHKHITNSPEPMGWSNQLKNEPGVVLSWQRRWPRALHYEVAGLSMGASPYFGASVGNIYTYGSTGVGFRLASDKSRWSDTPLRVQPAMSGTGFFGVPPRGWDWYLFGGVEGRAVARNIFLDGNTFSDSHSVDKFPLVGDAHAGIAFTFGRTRLSYTAVYRSREFQTQDSADWFGALSLGYRF